VSFFTPTSLYQKKAKKADKHPSGERQKRKEENMPNIKNKETVVKLKEKLEDAKSVIFADYTGLNANRLNELRKQVKAEGAELSITKNTLMKLALLEKTSHSGKKEKKTAGGKMLNNLTKQLKGQVIALFSYEDAIAPLKKLAAFAKTYEVPVVIVGIFEGKIVSAVEIAELSNLPSKEELLARFVGGLKAPLRGIVNVFGGTQRNFVYALSAIAEKEDKNSKD